MNKISTAVRLALVLVILAMSIYQFICIQEFKRDVATFSEDVQQFSRDMEDLSRNTQRINEDMRDMKFQVANIDKAVDLILSELWLARFRIPDPRPWQGKNDE